MSMWHFVRQKREKIGYIEPGSDLFLTKVENNKKLANIYPKVKI